MITLIIKQSALIVVLALLSACGNGIANVSDDDLRNKVQQCDYAVNLSAAEHQACENFHRECKRRLKSEGRFVCN
ncbi:MAG: hypothetical protein ACI843_000023 [Psychrobacter glaciei]|jgi:hypothetical protein